MLPGFSDDPPKTKPIQPSSIRFSAMLWLDAERFDRGSRLGLEAFLFAGMSHPGFLCSVGTVHDIARAKSECSSRSAQILSSQTQGVSL